MFIRLPVPTLAETSRQYLKTVAPLLNNDEFNETKKVWELIFLDFSCYEDWFYLDCRTVSK